jgi:glycosyltransferase involved in cell wall biosynthesis
MPKLSIITINYNNLEGLQKTIESVVNQTWQDFEYIVIDGGSTDGSKELIEQYQDKIDYWVSEPDKGIYNAMNKGIVKAKGEYLQFLNSGDFLSNSFVLNQVRQYLKFNDIVYGNIIKSRISSKHKVVKKVDRGPGNKELSLRTFISGTLNHSSTFISKMLFCKYGLYDENLKIVSDWKFFLIACGLNQCKAKYINIDISVFDMNGISNIQKENSLLERKFVLNKLVSQSIQLDYINTEDKWIRLSIINKYKIIAFMYRLIEILLVRLTRFFQMLHL